MNENCLVTIVMPVYKSEEFIEKSIASVRAQTYKNIELICVDDGTPDRAFEICKEIKEVYPNIVLLQNPEHQKEGEEGLTRNHGQEFTRNHGLEKAKGKYVLFLDSDDTLALDAVEKLVEIAENNNADIVMFTLMRIIDGEEVPTYCNGLDEGLYTSSQLAPHIYSDLDLGTLCCIGSKLYSMDFIRKHNISFDKKYKYNEDGAFTMNFLLKDPRVYFTNKPYYEYLIRTGGSVMSSYRPNMFKTIVQTRELFKELFQKTNCWDKFETQREYYREMFALMLNSLINEVKFGNRKSFNNAFDLVRDYHDFDELAEFYAKNGGMPRSRRLILGMIKGRHKFVTRAFVKMWVAIKL